MRRDMEIIWHGNTCFTFKGSSAIVVSDPYMEKGELKTPPLKADIVILTQEEGMNADAVAGVSKVIDWPGEYEAKDVLVMALETEPNHSIFHLEMDGFKIAHLGSLNRKLSEEEVEKLGDVDLVMIPVGGGNALDPKLAHEVVEQIDPRMVIPMLYKIEGSTEDYTELEPFLKEMGSHSEPRESLIVKNREELPEDTTVFVVLTPKLGLRA